MGRAYYALLHEGQRALDRWGVPVPPREDLHRFVRLRFNFGSLPDLTTVGRTLDDLRQGRNQADYRLASPGIFAAPGPATSSVGLAQTAIALLDAIEADPARRTAVIAAIRARWP
jgi:hypothetical protein